MDRGRRARPAGPVRASDLAEMGACERRVRFDATFGRQRSSIQERAAARGTRAHGQFMRDARCLNGGVKTSEKKGKCFIATAVYGDGPETAVLRRLRDQILRRTTPGRWAIGAYYRSGPALCRLIGSGRWRRAAVRTVLRPAMSFARFVTRPDEDRR